MEYDSVCELSQELFEVKRSTVGSIVDVLNDSEDDVVFLIEPESGGSDKEVSDISSSLSGIGVEGEQSVKFGDMLG